jgi:guanylate kinase
MSAAFGPPPRRASRAGGPRPASPAAAFIFIISGPAGSGKTTLCRSLVGRYGRYFSYAVTTTTRPPRPKEIDGRDYHFVDRPTFQNLLDRNAFCEHSAVHGQHLYGLTRDELERHFAVGRSALVTLDRKGAMAIKSLSTSEQSHRLPGRAVSIFLLPPSLEELRIRIRRRENATEEDIERRLRSVQNELQGVPDYDYVLPPDSPANAVRNFLHIYWAEQMRR